MNIVIVSSLAVAVERVAIELARQRHRVTVVVNARPWTGLVPGPVPGQAIVWLPEYCPRIVPLVGVLVAPEDPRALAEAVNALLDDPARRYAWPAIAERYVAEYAAAMGTVPARAAGGVESAIGEAWW